MTEAFHRAPQDERMSPRARFYMAVVAARTFALAVFCLVAPEDFTSQSYRGIIAALDELTTDTAIRFWGGVFLLTAIVALFATFTGREAEARAALILSIFGAGCWAGGFIAAMIGGYGAGPTGVVIWTAIVLKDASMLRQPLRNPFEPIARKVLGQRRKV